MKLTICTYFKCTKLLVAFPPVIKRTQQVLTLRRKDHIPSAAKYIAKASKIRQKQIERIPTNNAYFGVIWTKEYTKVSTFVVLYRMGFYACILKTRNNVHSVDYKCMIIMQIFLVPGGHRCIRDLNEILGGGLSILLWNETVYSDVSLFIIFFALLIWCFHLPHVIMMKPTTEKTSCVKSLSHSLGCLSLSFSLSD